MKLKLKIITLEGVYLEKEVDLLNVVTTDGEITILANHLPLIANLKISVMYIKEEGLIIKYALAGGVLYVENNEAKIITSAIESAHEIDFIRAQNAYERAKNRLDSKDEDIDIKRAEIALKKALNRLSLKEWFDVRNEKQKTPKRFRLY